MKIFPSGDSALSIELGNEISEEINIKVKELSDAIEKSHIKGVVELLPAYSSLMVFYDPEQTGYEKVRRKIVQLKPSKNLKNEQKKLIEIPCCYEREFAPDLDDIARETGLSTEEIISIHCGRDYRIYMLGFLPGFVYLGGLDKRIAVPRLKTPRKKITAGSVGIGGEQTGIYPLDSPGGWRLIGSTPIDMYDPKREKPVLCEAGQYLRFVRIGKRDYELINKDKKSGQI